MLFFSEALVQLEISAVSFNTLFSSFSTKSLRVSSVESILSWRVDSSAGFDGFGFFRAMV